MKLYRILLHFLRSILEEYRKTKQEMAESEHKFKQQWEKWGI